VTLNETDKLTDELNRICKFANRQQGSNWPTFSVFCISDFYRRPSRCCFELV